MNNAINNNSKEDKNKNYINNKGSIRSLEKISVLSYHGNLSASNFCNKIYSNASIFMQRKYDIYFKGFIQYRYLIETVYN